MDVSIIIVNYNTKELIRNCLKSVFEKTSGIEFEVIVSDNGSSDGSIEEFPQVILLENEENLGFGKANNRALKIANRGGVPPCAGTGVFFAGAGCVCSAAA